MTSPLGVALGKDIAGVAQVADLCGGVRQVAQTYGAFEDFRGCVKR